MNILVDSCVFLSFYSTDDTNHKKAVADFKHIEKSDYTIWLTEHIVDEVISILLRRNAKSILKNFGERIFEGTYKLYLPEKYAIAYKISKQIVTSTINQHKVKASYTDIYSMVIVQKQYLKNAKLLSYDHHFNSFDKEYLF
jgi:predicted nucleic acid-binding protein